MSTNSLANVQQLFPSLEEGIIDALIEKGEVKLIKAGDYLIKSGQYIRNTMLVMSGLVKIYREDQEGNEIFLYYVKPGEGCALSMVCAMRQEASQILAKAEKDTEVVMIPVQQMSEWMATHRSWYQFVVDTYRRRFDELLQTIDQVAFRAMDERLEFYLKRNQEILSTHIIPVSHQEIANELNSSREVVSRLLKKMEQRGKVILHRNSIEIIGELGE